MRNDNARHPRHRIAIHYYSRVKFAKDIFTDYSTGIESFQNNEKSIAVIPLIQMKISLCQKREIIFYL